jgi:radical SAM protein with 4Fe4S-binding SPASM domain
VVGNYILENIAGVRTIWQENTAQRCVIDLVIEDNVDDEPRRIKEIKCMVCKYFDFCNSNCNRAIKYTPDAKLKAIYKPTNVNIIDNPIEIYYREQDIDELEQYFQLGEIICFQEAPQELYILDINMLKKPCFKKCAMNIIPYKFVQMFGYRHYINSIYWPLINILPLDNEEKEYWDEYHKEFNKKWRR